MIDRLDVHIDVPAVKYQAMTRAGRRGCPSARVRDQVRRACDLQTRRFTGIDRNFPSLHLDTALGQFAPGCLDDPLAAEAFAYLGVGRDLQVQLALAAR